MKNHVGVRSVDSRHSLRESRATFAERKATMAVVYRMGKGLLIC